MVTLICKFDLLFFLNEYLCKMQSMLKCLINNLFVVILLSISFSQNMAIDIVTIPPLFARSCPSCSTTENKSEVCPYGFEEEKVNLRYKIWFH